MSEREDALKWLDMAELSLERDMPSQEIIATIRKALKAKEPEVVSLDYIMDIFCGFGWCDNAVEEINRLYPNGIIIKGERK